MSWLGDFFLTVMPSRWTSSGMTGWARFTRFWTSTWAMSESVPSLNVTVRVYVPSFVHCDDMYIMPSTPLTCSSIGAATVSRTVSAFAPGYTAVTTTVGGVTSGYWAIGRVYTATAPARVTTMDRTEAKIGRSMKKREITDGPLVFGERRPQSPGVSPINPATDVAG